MATHSILSIQTSKNGRGVFSRKKFEKGEAIIEFHGTLTRSKDLPPTFHCDNDQYVQVNRSLYMGPSGEADDILNHSCDPNAGLFIRGKKVTCIALRPIEIGEEITWDYSTTMDEAPWIMACNCQSPLCRKRIGNFSDLPQAIQEKYIALGVVPRYIRKPLRRAISSKSPQTLSSVRPYELAM